MSGRSQRILVAGATGVIGRALVPLLAEEGHTVIAMTRRAAAGPALRARGAEPVVADALDGDAVRRAVEEARPDVVVHQLTDLRAADSAANAALRIAGTRNLVDAARAAGVEWCIAQSICWAYAPGSSPAGEDVPLDLGAAEPRRTTIAGVAALEAAVAEMPRWVVLRYGQLYGPGTWYAGDGPRAADARSGRLTADDDVTSFVHVGDAAMAAVQALGWPSGAVNVCDDEPAPGYDWAPVYCRRHGGPEPPVSGVRRAPWARGAANHLARRELGWTPRYPSWRTGFLT